jgi:type III secretion protein R
MLRIPPTLKHRLLLWCVASLPILLWATDVFAKKGKRLANIPIENSVANNPLLLTVALAALALAPFLLIMITSFVKIAVVLSIVRSALGTQQNPPTQVITGLAIILTIYVMVPVGLDIKDKTSAILKDAQKQARVAKKDKNKQSYLSGATVGLLIKAAWEARFPIKRFLIKHSHFKDRRMFYGLAVQLRKPSQRKGLKDDDFTILVPSFVISELKEAFQIGFLIFLPFIVVDMVVANILLALGMHMLSPTTISLPFKLLLFVMVDGWYLITKGLIMGYL